MTIIKKAHDQFYRQTRRDQVVLLAGTVCVCLYCIWLLWLSPITQSMAEEQGRTVALVGSLSRVESLVSSIEYRKQEKNTSNSNQASMAELVDRSLRRNHLTMQGFQPASNGEVRLRFEAANYAHLLQWLHELEAMHGISVSEFTVTAGIDTGLVMANVRLRKGG
jgi:type II secretory pathway component PulM